MTRWRISLHSHAFPARSGRSSLARLAYRRVIDHPQVLFDESTADNVQSTIDFLVQANVLPAGTRSMQVVADFSYLNAVLDEIGRVH